MTIANVKSPTAPVTAPASSARVALAVVTSLFFMWGFVTVLNDVLVPHLKSIFDLNYAQASLIQFAFFLAYFIFSIPSAKLIDSIGYKKTMVVGVVVMGVGALLFIPSAMVPSYPLFLGALMILAGGITALQVAANPYVAVLGPPETASSRLNLSQAFNSLGTAIAPYLGGRLILSATARDMNVIRQMSPDALQAYRVQEASSVKLPYLVIGLALIALGVAISLFKLPPMPGAEHHKGDTPAESVWKHRNLVLGVVGIFVYVGAEVSIGSYLINYLSQTNIGNISEVAAAKYVVLLLGWCDGGPLYRLCHPAEGSHRHGAGTGRASRFWAGLHHHRQLRPRRHGEHHFCRVVQLRHVPQHFHSGDRGTGPAHRRRFWLAHHGHRGGRFNSVRARCLGRQHRTSSRIHSARDLLPLYCLLRHPGIETCRHRV